MLLKTKHINLTTLIYKYSLWITERWTGESCWFPDMNRLHLYRPTSWSVTFWITREQFAVTLSLPNLAPASLWNWPCSKSVTVFALLKFMNIQVVLSQLRWPSTAFLHGNATSSPSLTINAKCCQVAVAEIRETETNLINKLINWQVFFKYST